MFQVNVTEFRNHLPHYLLNVQKGNEILLTSHGVVIARIVPPVDMKKEAQTELDKLRQRCKIGDIISPIEDTWESDK